MTKGELIKLLEPFDDEIEIFAFTPSVGRLPILKGSYVRMESYPDSAPATFALRLPPLEVQVIPPTIRIQRKAP